MYLAKSLRRLPPFKMRIGLWEVRIAFTDSLSWDPVIQFLFCSIFTCKRPTRVFKGELELELIQPHMAHKPMLRGEVGARALRVRSVSREEVWASAGVQGAWVSGCRCEAD
jgi:hypothetical protein